MNDALDEIRFLADSQHREVAMEALAEGPQSRAALQATTGASSATVSRIVQAFEERGWLTREGDTYSLTTVGEFVATSFAAHHSDMEVAGELGELLPYVPVDEIGIDAAGLRDATITRATHTNPFAVVSRVRELELRSDEARTLTDFFPEPCIDGRYESIVKGTQQFEAVFAPFVFEAAMTSDAASKFEAIVAAERADVYLYEEDIWQPVMFHDGEACLIVRNEQNVSIGLIETDDERVVEWVTDHHNEYRAEARRLPPEELDAFGDDGVTQV